MTVAHMMKEIQEKKEPVVAERIEIAEPNNGGQFVSKIFEDCLRAQLIFHHKVDKGCPWQNGKIEWLFKILFEEWINYRRYNPAKSLKESLEEFRNWFNNEREIQKLGYKTPMQIMKEKSNN